MTLHDAVGINCKKGATKLKIRVQVSSIWAKGCILYITVVSGKLFTIDISYMDISIPNSLRILLLF